MTPRRLITGLVFVAVAGTTVPVDAQNAIIRGVVRDPQDNPLSEVTVTAENAEWRRTEEVQTDENGVFSFIGLQSGRWLFMVRKRGYEPSQGFANVRRTGDSGVIEFELRYDPLNPPAPSTGQLAGVRMDELQADLDAAHALFDLGDFDGAIEAYESVLTTVPVLTSLNVQIGHAYRAKDELDRAMEAYHAVPADSAARSEAESAIEALNALMAR